MLLTLIRDHLSLGVLADRKFSSSISLRREFVGCVRCIRILSPTEVQQMSEEGMKLLNSAAMQGINGNASDAGHA